MYYFWPKSIFCFKAVRHLDSSREVSKSGTILDFIDKSSIAHYTGECGCLLSCARKHFFGISSDFYMFRIGKQMENGFWNTGHADMGLLKQPVLQGQLL